VASADQYIQRAELLADLGRYEDAAGELDPLVAAEPHNVRALTILARIRLAANQPAEAIVAADAAVTADPENLAALVARGMVLVELDRARDAADTAERILRLGPEDGYAQTSAAAILAEVRNGQRALDAAWRGVQLAPEDATAHLVLGLVSARMQLYDLAERGYREALRLDPELAAARDDVGIVRLEQRRYAEALEHLAEAAVMVPPVRGPDRAVGYGLRQVLHVGAGYALVAPIIAACVGAGADGGTVLWRATAMLLALFGFIGLGVFLAQLPGRVSELLPVLLRTDRRLAVATAAVVAAPCLILLYALVGSPWPLAAAIAAGAVALLSALVGDRAAR
jgi:tetratricopeptide (TPR) repeat protein